MFEFMNIGVVDLQLKAKLILVCLCPSKIASLEGLVLNS